MKKMLLATALWPLLITGCAQQTFTVQNKPAAVAPETITHHFFVSGIGQKKTVDAAKICGGAENVVKTETQQTFVNGLLGFLLTTLYSAGSACVLLTIIMSCPSIWATLSALLINILLGSFQLFLHSSQPLSEGEIIPFSGVCQSGETALSTPEAVVASRGGRLYDVQPTTTSGSIITQSIIPALASANSFVYFAHQAQQHHADASACQ